MPNHVKIFDTTLRDGEQSPGCSMNLTEKLEMARQLEKLRVDIIEAGFAISSPGDFESVRAISETVRTPVVASLARLTQKDIDTAWDAVRVAQHPRIHVFIATSPIHMQYKLKMSPNEVIERVRTPGGVHQGPGGGRGVFRRGRHAQRVGLPRPRLYRGRPRRSDDAERAGHGRLYDARRDVRPHPIPAPERRRRGEGRFLDPLP